MKKKWLSLLLVFAMVLSLTACGNNGSETAANETEAPTNEAEQEPAAQEEAEAPAAEEAAPASDGDTIKIGVLCYLSSTRSATLGFFQIGWEAAAAEINAAGGIDGKNVEFLLYDPQGDAAQVSQRLTEAKNDGCVAALFTSGDDLAPTAAEWAEENKFPVILQSNTSTEVTLKNTAIT